MVEETTFTGVDQSVKCHRVDCGRRVTDHEYREWIPYRILVVFWTPLSGGVGGDSQGAVVQEPSSSWSEWWETYRVAGWRLLSSADTPR